jgi:hypothetical protein
MSEQPQTHDSGAAGHVEHETLAFGVLNLPHLFGDEEKGVRAPEELLTDH